MMIRCQKACKIRKRILQLLAFLLCCVAVNIHAQDLPPKKKAVLRRSISSSMLYGYTQVGSTDLCVNKNVNGYNGNLPTIDIQGKFNSNYYGSTYNNCGYEVAMQVGDNSAVYLDCMNGSTINGVKFESDVVAQADLARVCYYITNTNDRDTVISLGIHADVMIGNNDRAPIVRKIDTIGNTYGLALLDGNGAQLCVLFGAGLAGVTGVSDFWFGGWSLNSSPSQMVGNYSSGSNYMVENGSYDSGMGWCWKNRTIPAGATVTFSWLIGVGDVKLEPNSNFEVTPEDPEGWNDLTRLHVLAMEGDYESPAGLTGKIQYAVEDSEEWIDLTEMMESGSVFQDTVRAMFNPNLDRHTIRFRTVDQVGNTSLLPSIVYPDVSFHALGGVVDKTYTGDSIFQTDVTCDLDDEWYELKNYQNNVNIGTASFNLEGVFPNTIGRKTYNFTINPQPLTGSVNLSSSEFVYTGDSITTEWQFSHEPYSALVYNRDYTVTWSNNKLPGTATLTITGKGNYTGSLTANFTIDKAPLTEDLYQLTLPEADVTYDGERHGAVAEKAEGVGNVVFSYTTKDQTDYSTEQPKEPGEYDIYLEIAEGSLYYGLSRTKIGSFSIFQFDAADWEALQTIHAQLSESGWTQPWDMSSGIKGASSLSGLTIEEGHVTAIDLKQSGLTGSFPVSLLALSSLKSIDLSGNSFSGSIEDVASYIEQHPDATAGITSVSIANNQFAGNIGAFAQCFGDLTSLDASSNGLEEVSPKLSPTITSLNLSGQNISRVVDIHLGSTSAETLVSTVPPVLLYNHAAQTYNSAINLTLSQAHPDETTDDSWVALLHAGNGQISFNSASTKKVYRGASGDLLYATALDNSMLRIKFQFDSGDVDFSGSVNVLDLQAVINYMFEEYNDKLFNFTAANLWNDEQINVQDAVSLVNLLLESSSTAQSNARRASEHSSEVAACVYIEDGNLVISSAVPVASFDIIATTDQGWTIADELTQMGFNCIARQNSNQVHLIGYSLSGITLPAGQTVIGKTGNGAVSQIMLANQEAQEIPSAINKVATGISSTVSDSEKEAYRLSVGARRAISIDVKGKKTMIKNEK